MHKHSQTIRFPRKRHVALLPATFCAMTLAGHLFAQTDDAASKARTMAEANRITKAVEESTILFSCDQVDVRTFVKMMSKELGQKFIIDDDVKGKVTVIAPRIRKRDAFPIFVSVLESAGCSVARDGEMYRVIMLPQKGMPSAPVVGPDEAPAGEGVITKIFRLENVYAEEVRRAIAENVPSGKAVLATAIRDTNHLIVTDTVKNIQRIEKLISEVDKPGMARITEVVSLQHAAAEDLADQLNQALTESESRAEQLKRRLPQAGDNPSFRRPALVVPSPHSNKLILVGATSQVESLKALIAKMDVEAPLGRGRLNALFLKYISAEAAAKSLNSLLGKGGAKDRPPTERSDRIALEANPANNALLVDATPSDFDVVKKLIEQIDIPPQQVHIDVIIAEHSTDTNLNLGVDFVAVGMPSDKDTLVVQGSSLFREGADSLMGAIQQGLFPKGITVGVAKGERVDDNGKMVTSYPGAINIDALKKMGNVHIRSETSLQTQDNLEASVNVVNQIPILKSTIQGGAGTSRDVIQNIERTDVGVKLKMTPHIIPGGEVQMTLNTSIEAVIDPGPASTLFTPTIARREVLTTVTVPDGKVIVIAGLTREDKTQIVRKVPILGSIPLLGLLFRHSVDSVQQTNLLILVTPQIVSNNAAASRVADDWRQRTGLETVPR